MWVRFKYPWLKSAYFDLSLILLPSLTSIFLSFIFSSSLENTKNISLWAWVVFVLCIDVSHVYSTLFRTYFNSNEFKENKIIFTLIPILTWLVGVFLYSIDALYFWRVLAYVAVFHFIRQQYGFLRLYTKSDQYSWGERFLDSSMIYASTLYPILYWHTHQPRNFHWFVDGDFIQGLPSEVSRLFGFFYLGIILVYFLNEVKKIIEARSINLPKNLIILGTAISWYFGIVYFNGDMIFTITNVVSHGIPYMALVWLYGERQKDRADAPLILKRLNYKLFFSKYSVFLFLGVLLIFAYIEEGLWDGFIWREHLSVFGVMSKLPTLTTKDTLSWLVPLLSLPQATHYVLDGFIWKVQKTEANWQKVLFSKRVGYL